MFKIQTESSVRSRNTAVIEMPKIKTQDPETIAERIRDAQADSHLNDTVRPVVFDYDSLRTHIAELHKTQALINRQAVKERGGCLTALVYHAEDRMRHLVSGNGHYNLSDLFGQQLDNLSGLNDQLRIVEENLGASIDHIEQYQDDVYTDLLGSLSSRPEAQKELEAVILGLETLTRELMSWEGPKEVTYFEKERDLEKRKAELAKSKLTFSMNGDDLVMALQERASISAYLETMRAGRGNCARLNNNIQRTEQHLRQVKTMYESGKPLRLISSQLFKGLQIIAQLTNCIYSEFEQGMHGAKQLLQMNPAGDLFGVYGRKMHQLRAQIEEASFAHDKRNEEIIGRYLNP